MSHQVGLSQETYVGDDGDDNFVGGWYGFESFFGRGGDDYLDGGPSGMGFSDLIYGGAGNDTLIAGGFTNTLYGGSGDDVLHGAGSGATSSLNGGSGRDTVNGGAGFDTLSFFDHDDAPFTQGIVADLRTGTIQNDGYGNAETMSGVEAFSGGTRFADAFYGDDQRNEIDVSEGDTGYGFGGDDSFQGSGIPSLIDGGTGRDAANLIFHDAAAVVDLAAETISSGGASGTIRGIETVYGTSESDRITGDAAANALYGQSGDDILDGGLGADLLVGGYGNDTYFIDDAGDRVIEDHAGGGYDSIFSSVSYSIIRQYGGPYQYIERLTLTGTGAIDATGNGLANTLVGNGAANRLDGLTGVDVLGGRGGDDTYVVDQTGDSVIEEAGEGTDTVLSAASYWLTDVYEVENLTLTGAERINATGNRLDNILTGNGHHNFLNGGEGADTMIGGAGNDRYRVENAGDRVIETSALGGTDTVESSITYTLEAGQHVERLELTGSGAIDGIGNEHANRLYGNDAANRLDGGAGADYLSGGAGDDTYIVDHSGDRVHDDQTSGGYDTVLSSVSFSLAYLSIERLVLTGDAAVDGTGNSAAQTIDGNAATNVLSGLAGDDALYGWGGDDILFGGRGSDRLDGGSGADRFHFDTAPTGEDIDILVGFVSGLDAIHLDRRAFTAFAADGPLSASAFARGTVAADADDRIVYDKASGNVFYDADGNGSGAAILFLKVGAGTEIEAADFNLYG